MNKLLTILLLLSIVFTQTSSLSLYGLGEIQQSYDPSSISMGDMKYFSAKNNGVSLASPSSFWKSGLTRLNMSTSFNWNVADSISTQFGNTINFISFAVPVGKNKTFNVGFKPYTRNQYNLTESMNPDSSIYYDGETLTYNSHYIVDGGITNLFLTYSTLITEKFSVGLQWDIGFGTQTRTDSIFIYNTIVDYDGNVEYQQKDIDVIKMHDRFSSNAINLEGRLSFDSHEFVLGIEYFKPLIINSSRINDFTIAPDKQYRTENKNLNYGFGYLFKHSSNFGVACEVQRLNYVSVPEEVSNFHKPFADSQTNLHFGVYKRFHNKKHGIWKTIVTSAGCYGKQYLYGTSEYYDFGFTAGSILEWGDTRNSISLGLKVGSRTSEFIEFTNEKYLSLIVGITVGENWFIKRKRK